MNDLVSIIIPVYNAEKYLKDTINSIQNQTYQNFEVLFIDDMSKDKSVDLIEKEIKKDKRYKLIKLEENSGAAIARNTGIENSKGKYICFLDADDFWNYQKLEKQIKFMKENDCAFSYTGYQFTDAKGNKIGKKVFVPNSITYNQALKNTTIWTSTVMFDMDKLLKKDILMPNVKRGQDTATWWKVLKKIGEAYGLNEILSFYRRSDDTLSSNKLKALKRTWNLYRNVEHLNIFYSFYCFAFYCFNAVRRRV